MDDTSVEALKADMVAGRAASARQRAMWRGSALAAGITAAVLGLAACGGSSGSSSNAGESQTSQLLAFSSCIRSHGVPNFPDANDSEKFPGPQQLGVSTSQYQAAMNACEHLLPNGGAGSTQAELQQERIAMLPFARCMRSHGVPNWPDPSIYTNPDGITAVVFDLRGIQGVDDNGFDSPQVQAAVQQCSHLLPPSYGGSPFHIVRS